MNSFSLPRIFALAAGLFVLAGCTGGPRVSGLGVSIVGVKGAEASLMETRLVATLRIVNENVIPIGVSGGKHKLYLNGTYVGQAVSKESLGLPQLSTGTQDVTFMLENTALVAKLRSMAESSQASYRLESVIYIDAGEERLETKAKASGAVDLRGLTPQP